MELLAVAATADDVGAAYDLGAYLQSGTLVERDLNAARGWYERAVDGDHVMAMTNLADLLMEQGGEEGTARAMALLEQAAAADETLAMAKLSARLVTASVDAQDHRRARALAEAAGRAGRVEAYYVLGYLLASGIGGDRDLKAGLEWLNQAVNAGNSRARTVLRFLDAAARSWPLPEAVLDHLRNRLGWAEHDVARLVDTAAYRDHLGEPIAPPEDPDSPAALFRRGVELARRTTPPDFVGALECYRRAAEQGNAEATYNLGYAYLQGEGVAQDVDTGLGWLRRAAEMGAPQMQYELGVLLSEGTLTAPDCAEAAHWYRRAADQGFPHAMHNLAWCYLQGTGVARDKEAAVALYRKGTKGARIGLFVIDWGHIARRPRVHPWARQGARVGWDDQSESQ
jgi:TPR repeat protein